MATVSVLGAGTMGRGIAGSFAAAGHEVAVFDAAEQTRAQLVERASSDISWAMKRGSLPDGNVEEMVARITVATSIKDACTEADLVIEAVFEDTGLKRDVLGSADDSAPTSAILASNTSSLSLSAIATGVRDPQRVVGMHFFNPPLRMPLVEVVRQLATDPQLLADVTDIVRDIGKEPVVVRDSPGFATSRLSAMIGNEAFYMLQEGVASAEDIDTAAQLGLSFPMGPLALGDLVGLDVRLGVLNYLHRTLGEKFRPCPLLASYVDAGRLGRKTGRGVFRYGQDGKRVPGSADAR